MKTCQHSMRERAGCKDFCLKRKVPDLQKRSDFSGNNWGEEKASVLVQNIQSVLSNFSRLVNRKFRIFACVPSFRCNMTSWGNLAQEQTQPELRGDWSTPLWRKAESTGDAQPGEGEFCGHLLETSQCLRYHQETKEGQKLEWQGKGEWVQT